MERFKPQAEWSTAEFVEHRRNGAIPENPDYVEARAKALSDAGLEAEDAASGESDEQGLTTAGHLARSQERARP